MGIVQRTTGCRIKSSIGYMGDATFSVTEGRYSVICRVDVVIGHISFGSNGFPMNDFQCNPFLHSDAMKLILTRLYRPDVVLNIHRNVGSA